LILQSLEISARPSTVNATPCEYGSEPVKTAHSTVEADLALAQVFGVDLGSPNSERTTLIEMEKAANGNDLVITRIMEIGKDKEADGSIADRIMMAGEEGVMPDSAAALSTDMVPDTARMATDEHPDEEEIAGRAKQAMGPMALDAGAAAPDDMGEDQSQHPEITHRENMRSMERRVELEKKKQELMTMQSKAIEAPGDMGGAPGAGDEAGPPPAEGGMPGGPPPDQAMGADPMAGGDPAAGGGMPPEGAGGMPPPTGPMPAGPPMGLPGGGPLPMKKAHVEAAAELTKQAMVYAKSGRKHAGAVLDDLREATSLGRIKQATADQNPYPDANPFGDLIRTKEKLSRVLDDASHARDKNGFMMKEAHDNFLHQVTQHMFAGGNLGEVTHAVSCVTDNEEVMKVAMINAIEHLTTKGLDIDKARAALIQYEMEKGASARAINPNNPIVETFAAFCKIASTQEELEQAVTDVQNHHVQVEKVLSEAMLHA